MGLFLFLFIIPFLVTLDARQEAVIQLNIYSKLVHNFICRDGMNSTITALAQYGKCIESHVDDNYKDWLHKCWHEVAGVEYPTSRDEWTSFYCQHKEPWVLKNIADHCFISRWKTKVGYFKFKDLTNDCVSFELDAQDIKGVASECNESVYYDIMRHMFADEENKEYRLMKQAYKDMIDKICSDTQLTQDEI